MVNASTPLSVGSTAFLANNTIQTFQDTIPGTTDDGVPFFVQESGLLLGSSSTKSRQVSGCLLDGFRLKMFVGSFLLG